MGTTTVRHTVGQQMAMLLLSAVYVVRKGIPMYGLASGTWSSTLLNKKPSVLII